jgi:hypothetical protein
MFAFHMQSRCRAVQSLRGGSETFTLSLVIPACFRRMTKERVEVSLPPRKIKVVRAAFSR